ncbi:MAG TPA: hemerythrin domain-containing protein [Caulobacteraceae bacterium]
MSKAPSGREKLLVAAGAAVAGLVAGVAVASGRRAAVEVTDSLAGDWLDGLTAEHLEIIEAFDLIEASKAKAPARRRKQAARLRSAIEKHAFQEETVVYPAARVHGAEDAVNALVARQAEIKFQLYRLDQIEPDDPHWSAAIEALRRAVEQVINGEEMEIFPLLRDKLDAKAAADLTALVYRSGSKLG